MKVAVLGSGSWGTALSIHLTRAGHDVLLWARDPEVCSAIERTRLHPRRLTAIPIPAAVRVTPDLDLAASHSDTAIVAVPCVSFRDVLAALSARSRTRRFLSAAKGIEPETLKRMSEIVCELRPGSEVAALSGPTSPRSPAPGMACRRSAPAERHGTRARAGAHEQGSGFDVSAPGRWYAPSPARLTRPRSAMSREIVACVASKPRLRRRRRSCSWLWSASRSMSSRISAWRRAFIRSG